MYRWPPPGQSQPPAVFGPPSMNGHPPVVPQRSYAPLESDGRATLALVLGVLSVTCFGAFTGLPAIIVGAIARRDIRQSYGRLRGSGIATGGIVTGMFGTSLSIALGALIMSGVLGIGDRLEARKDEGPSPVALSEGTKAYGTFEVSDLDGRKPLRPQLTLAATRAAETGRTVVIQTFLGTSSDCAEVAEAYKDARMQRALSDVTILRVDIRAFEKDLRAMRLETETVPWFYKLDVAAFPIDGISADEWDENVAENIAPVLGAFASGSLRSRRTPAPIGTSL